MSGGGGGGGGLLVAVVLRDGYLAEIEKGCGFSQRKMSRNAGQC